MSRHDPFSDPHYPMQIEPMQKSRFSRFIVAFELLITPAAILGGVALIIYMIARMAGAR
jgi:hypothetical protein